MKRPNLEQLRRVAERGINLKIPQAWDMAETIDYALELEKALLFVRGLEVSTPEDDPLREIRKQVHTEIDAALGAATASDGAEPSSPEAKK